MPISELLEPLPDPHLYFASLSKPANWGSLQ
uniref:Uncharacterized protein n=1 Tax=Anguilla anguilla TaxID=7936 RepID=A0A0E9SK75_ANGAN